MKNKRGNRQQAALAMQEEIFDMPNANVIRTIGMTEHPLYQEARKRNDQGSCEDCRFMLLEDENCRLETLVEELRLDKLSQAQRLKELHEEKSRLKNAFAELIVDNQNFKKAVK